jgi:hypothetical protein
MTHTIRVELNTGMDYAPRGHKTVGLYYFTFDFNLGNTSLTYVTLKERKVNLLRQTVDRTIREHLLDLADRKFSLRTTGLNRAERETLDAVVAKYARPRRQIS